MIDRTIPGVPDAPLSAYRSAIHGRSLDPSTTALVIVDLQYGSASREYGYGPLLLATGQGLVLERYVSRVENVVVPSVQRLQRAFRSVGASVLFLTFGTVTGDFSDMPPRFRRGVDYWRGIGFEPPYARVGTRSIEVLDDVAPSAGEPCLVKTVASGVVGTPMVELLRDRAVRAVVVCGVTTSYCVESTLRDLADSGFDVVLAEDACAELTEEMHERGVKGCAAFGRVASAADIASELTSLS